MHLTERTTLRRLPVRGSHDPESIYAILDAAFLAHVGFVLDGQPFVIPTLYGRLDDKLYFHGSAASRMLGNLAAGVPACVTVSLLDGIVLARSAFHHSINYRSVVAFGSAVKVEDPEKKRAALTLISNHLMAGRWEDVRPPTEQEVKATSVVEFHIDEASAKVRVGPPLDDQDDHRLDVWAGVVPMRLQAGEAIPDPALREEIALPRYVTEWIARSRAVPNGKIG